MRRGRASVALLLAAAVTAAEPAGSGSGEEPRRDPRLGATGAAAPDPDVGWVVAPLENLRGLSFAKVPPTRHVSREEARAYMSRLLARDYPPEKLAAEQEAYVYFGFLHEREDLERTLLDLLEDQVAGFYDPAAELLYVVPGPLAGSLAVAHEMAHALADQHFDLERLQVAARGDDDRALALASLIEGEAMMVTSLWAIQSAMDPSMPPLATEDPAEMIQAASKGLGEVPRILEQTLTFPYLAGSIWAADVMRRGGGLKALDPFFAEPPDSTEQILHPERSIAPRDRPALIDDSLLESVRPPSDPVVKLDTMGEFGIRILLEGEAGEAAAEGWDGDRYLLAGAKGARHLTWISAWDSESDAEEFAAAAAAWLRSRPAAAGGSEAIRIGALVVVAEGGGSASPAAARAASLAGRLQDGVHPR